MPVLSSFINYKTKRKAKSAAKSPFSVPRFDPVSTSHPYASPDVLDINDSSLRASEEFEEPKISPPLHSRSPRMRLDIDLSQEPLADWFPSNFLKSDSFIASLEGDMGTAGSRMQYGNPRSNIASRFPIKDFKMENLIEDDDGDISTSSEDVVANLEAMDASTFVNLSNEQKEGQTSSPFKKYPPTPITIPSATSQRPQVQIIRSGDSFLPYGQSRPHSVVSSAESSAVSGTTLARALLANTFSLTSDTHSSRYRSGFSTLTRSDSATLPRGEHPLLNSPYFRERTLSGGESITPGTGDIPPIPANAELLYVPPQTPRHSASERKKTNFTLSRRSSTGSLDTKPLSPLDTSAHNVTSTRSNSVSLKHPDELAFLDRHRISRISEAPSSAPPTPEIPHKGAKVGVASKETPVPRSPLPPLPALLPTSPESSSSRPMLDSELPTSPNSNNSVYHTSELNPTSPGQSSTSNQSSPKDLGDVLDYYSFVGTPSPTDRNFRPAVSPISEESYSLLSPATPFTRRDSQRGPPIGARLRSPMTPPAGRTIFRKNSEPRPLSKSTLLPIGERPPSIQVSPMKVMFSNGANPRYKGSSPPPAGTESNEMLSPPPLSKIFSRERSGSAPSPIKVVRDSKDFTAYNITVSPLASGSSNSTPTSGTSEEGVNQQFPETPSAFSPVLSPGSGPSPGRNSAEYVVAPPMPSTPMSATLGSMQQPSLAQQILLTRAATSVQGARHSRQGSLARARIMHDNLHAKPTISTSSSQPSEEHEDNGTGPNLIGLLTEESATDTGKLLVMPSVSPVAEEDLEGPEQESLLLYTPVREINTSPLLEPKPPSPIPESNKATHPQVGNSHGSESPSTSVIPLSQTASQHKSLPPLPPTADEPPSSPESKQSARGPRSRPPGLTLEEWPNPASISQPVAVVDRCPSPIQDPEPTEEEVNPPPVLVSPPEDAQFAKVPPHHAATNSADFSALGSPPPYYTVVDGENPNANLTPATPNPPIPPALPLTPTYSIRSDQHSVGRDSSMTNRKNRTRPPLPAGPRRPSIQHGTSSPHQLGGRERNGSVSSVSSTLPYGSARGQHSAFISPKFQLPPVKYRGFTMEAAKWTFSSAQLQSIVSRAIRQSAEASSIRLLRLETLDSDIPEELQRLEMRKTDIKTNYKMLTRRRANLLESLTNNLEEPSLVENAAVAIRKVADLKEVTLSLDKLTEELHSVSEQIAQLENLKQVHSASALSMALRKLNASLLKQLAETEMLRKQVQTLEAERDDGWKQAEALASDFDRYLNDKVEPSTDVQGKRSSRVLAVRKSSLRASRAGLRSASNRWSHRSSIGSSGNRLSAASPGIRSPFSTDIPPVPPIPRRRPVDIRTDLPSRSSAGLSTDILSSDMMTPTSEMRALAQVQEELYTMLGITMPEKRLRRSRSAISISSNSRVSVHPAILSASRSYHDVPHTPSRPTSLPGDSTMAQAYNANRNAMLATLNMLSSQE